MATARKLSHYLDPKKPLQGKDLFKAARALARLQTMPQVHAYGRLAHQLGVKEQHETKGLKRLGRTTGKTVSGVYRNLAAEEAKNVATQQAIQGQLSEQTAGLSSDYENQIAQGATGELGSYLDSLQAKGAPGGGLAQQQLANLVASQQQAGAADARASQALAASQGASSTQLAVGLKGASALQGAQTRSSIARDIASRIGESRLGYGQDIREAKGKQADARAGRGAQIVSSLMQLRGSEEDYILGRAATRQQGRSARLSAQTSRANSRRTAASSAASLAETHRHNVASEQNARRDSGPSGEGQKAHDAQKKQIRARTHRLLGLYPPKSKWSDKKLRHYIASIQEKVATTEGVKNEKLVSRLVERMVHHRLKKPHRGSRGGGPYVGAHPGGG